MFKKMLSSFVQVQMWANVVMQMLRQTGKCCDANVLMNIANYIYILNISIYLYIEMYKSPQVGWRSSWNRSVGLVGTGLQVHTYVTHINESCRKYMNVSCHEEGRGVPVFIRTETSHITHAHMHHTCITSHITHASHMHHTCITHASHTHHTCITHAQAK